MILTISTDKKFFTTILIIVFILLFTPARAFPHSQALSSWFRENSYSVPYRIIEPELHEVFENIESRNIPSVILIEKMNEGVTKNIESSQLLSALREEAERLKIAQNILSAIDSEIDMESVSIPLIKGISIFLLGGICEVNIRIFIRETIQNESGISTFLTLGRTLLSILSITELSIKNQRLLGNSLLTSNLPVSGYSAISSLFLKGKRMRLDSEEILFIIVESLENGEGIIRIENEINRRGKSQ